MEKSIESIWKEGFLDDQDLVAPKLNDLYNKKSQHIVDKFRRRFRFNLVFIAASSIVAFAGYASAGAYVVASLTFLSLNLLAVTSYRGAKKMKEIDQGLNSYEYLKAFDNQLKDLIANYTQMYRFMYPVFFVLMVSGIWFSNFRVREMERLSAKLPTLFYTVNGVPVYLLTGVIIITAILTYYGKRIYLFDLKLMYGRILRKLDTLIKDMEELRK